MFHFLEDGDLIDNGLQSTGVLLKRDLFDRHHLPGVQIHHFIHLTKPAFSRRGEGKKEGGRE